MSEFSRIAKEGSTSTFVQPKVYDLSEDVDLRAASPDGNACARSVLITTAGTLDAVDSFGNVVPFPSMPVGTYLVYLLAELKATSTAQVVVGW